MQTTVRSRLLGYALGVEMTGIDVTQPLDDAAIGAIRAALGERVLVCLPGQQAGPAQLRAFAARFGEIDDNSRFPHNRHPDHDEVVLLTNQKIVVSGKTAGGYGVADMWHSDYAFTLRPTPVTFLLAEQIPSIGGDTIFSNMYAAYDALSDGMKAIVDGLEGIHDVSLGATFARNPPERQAAMRAMNPPVIHPVVVVHPDTGRKALYLGDRLRSIAGMTEDESRPLVRELHAHAIAYERTYRHRWTAGDLLLWDNRCAMHFAVQDYDPTELRRMIRCSLLGPETGRAAP